MKTTIPPTTTTKNGTEPKFKSARGVTGQLPSWASMNRPRWGRGFVLIALILAGFALSPSVLAVVPAPDGGYPGANTAEGDDALFSLTTGIENTAVGSSALADNTTGDFNTAVGSQALRSYNGAGVNTAVGHAALGEDTTGTANTAIGEVALFNNTTGNANTAIGEGALVNNTTSSENTAVGSAALTDNPPGDYNTAVGSQALRMTTGTVNTAVGHAALLNDTTGSFNTAIGDAALLNNTTSEENTAVGSSALADSPPGSYNTAVGSQALRMTTGTVNTAVGHAALLNDTTGSFNTAIGDAALLNNTTGSGNIALGDSAGFNLTTGDNTIDIGNSGVAGESNTIRIGTQGTQTRTFIAGISGSAVIGRPVMINGSGRLGVAPSSARYKDEIKPMARASEAIYALKPVTFRYKKEIDAERTPEFGLVAEEVEKVDPDLVVPDANGKPYTVRYDAVNAMLLNEFLKEHRRVQEQAREIQQQKATISELKNGMETVVARLKEQDSRIQKVSAQIEMGRPTKVVLNRP